MAFRQVGSFFGALGRLFRANQKEEPVPQPVIGKIVLQLSDASRTMLLGLFETKYEIVLCDEVLWDPRANETTPLPDCEDKAFIFGYANSGSMELLLCELGGSTTVCGNDPALILHIPLSIQPGQERSAGFLWLHYGEPALLTDKIRIEVTARFVPR